jgi:hypothetical protein
MSRIRIENLPTVENLTQEELDQIFGAGLRSFKPAFDALEDRQLMAAGLIKPMMPNLAPPKAPVASFTQGLLANAQLAAPSAAAAVDQQDVVSLRKQTTELFKKGVLENNVLANQWGYKRIVGYADEIVGNEARIKLQVEFKNILGSGTVTLQWNYSFWRFQGSDKLFKLESTSHAHYQGGWAEHGDGGIDARNHRLVGTELFGREYVQMLRVSRPDAVPYGVDMRKAADEAIQRIGKRFNDWSVNGRHLVGNGKVEAVTDQGFTVKFRVQSHWMPWQQDRGVESQMEAEVSLSFKYQGAVYGFERFTCTDVKAGVVSVVSRDRYNGNARYDHPNFDAGTVGINEGGLKADYQSFLAYGDGRTLQNSVGALVQQRLKELNIHGQPDGWSETAVGQPMWGAVEKIAGGYRVTFRVEIGVTDSAGNFIDTLGLGSYEFQMVIKDTGEVQCTGTNRMAKDFISAADAEKFQNSLAADISAKLRAPAAAGSQVDLSALAAAYRDHWTL